MVKEKTIYTYYCDLCGKEITEKVYSPIWGELDPEGDGNFEGDGDIMNVDICSYCVKKADRMIVDLFTKNRQADGKSEDKRDLVEVSQELVEVSQELVKGAEPELAQEDIRSTAEELASMEKPKGHSRKKVEIDIDKAVRLYNEGYTHGEIAKELNVSTSTIQRRLKEYL